VNECFKMFGNYAKIRLEATVEQKQRTSQQVSADFRLVNTDSKTSKDNSIVLH